MKKTTIIIISILVIIIILSSIIVYSKSQVDSNQLEDKISQELIYLDQYFVTMLGEFNGLSIGDNRLQETEPKIQTNINTNLSDQADKNKTQGNDNLQQNSKVENKTDTVQNGILKNDGKYDAKWDKIETEWEKATIRLNHVSHNHFIHNEGKKRRCLDLVTQIGLLNLQRFVKQLFVLCGMLCRIGKSNIRKNGFFTGKMLPEMLEQPVQPQQYLFLLDRRQ